MTFVRSPHVTFSAAPYAQGLYDPANEHDACGVAFVVDARGRRSHAIVEAGLTALRNLEHRGAAGCEVNSGDGAGILMQVPHEFLRAVTDFPLPEPTAAGEPTYAVGNAFLPADTGQRARAIAVIERIISEEGVKLVGWRDLPINAQDADLGPSARSVQPHFAQLFI